jgi:NAD(P)-dependent dehydrogenase (short-subunit alcohol dehydrogenase family)
MLKDFTNKTALVVGGTTGIGEAVVRQFFDHGCNVVFAGIEDDLGVALQRSLQNNNGARTLFVRTDGYRC